MKKIMLLIVSVFTLLACDKNNGPKSDKKTIEIENGETNHVVWADDTKGKGGITFKTKGEWNSTITESESPKSMVTTTKAGTPSWISIDPENGNIAGTYTINITLDSNFTGEKRSATITINCGEDKITITVTQEGVKSNGEKLPKLIKKINFPPFDGTTYADYEYDSQGRMIKRTDHFINNGKQRIEYIKYRYIDNKIELSIGGYYLGEEYTDIEKLTCTLDKNGYVTKIESGEEGIASIEFEYKDGYLITETELSLDKEEVRREKTNNIWENGNMVSSEHIVTIGDKKISHTKTMYYYGEVKNNLDLGIDINTFMMNHTLNSLGHLMIGKRSTNLITKYKTEGTYTREYIYRYDIYDMDVYRIYLKEIDQMDQNEKEILQIKYSR